jgi:hypothetical protein
MPTIIKPLVDRITQLENTLVTIEKICDHLEEDRRETDKVLCHLLSIRFEITKAYPKYMREEKQ